MKQFLKVIRFTILILVFSLQFSNSCLAIEEMELKRPSWTNNPENVLLKGNVKATVEKIAPLTGIGVIGLRFIHQAGYPSYVEEVYSNSPASRADIRPKDLIFAIDGVRTDYLSSDNVYQLLTGEPGTKVKIFITRGESMFNVEVAREDLANLPTEVQNRYLSGPIAVPVNIKDLIPYN